MVPFKKPKVTLFSLWKRTIFEIFIVATSFILDTDKSWFEILFCYTTVNGWKIVRCIRWYTLYTRAISFSIIVFYLRIFIFLFSSL